MNTNLDRPLRYETEHAETHMDDDYEVGPNTVITRPGETRAKVLSVRMNPGEYAALANAADAAGVPPSTLARGYILRQLDAHASPAELLERIERLEQQMVDRTA